MHDYDEQGGQNSWVKKGLELRLANAEATCEVLNNEYERIKSKNEHLKKDLKACETLLAEFEDLGREYEKRINRYYFYKHSKLYEARKNSVEAGGGQPDS